MKLDGFEIVQVETKKLSPYDNNAKTHPPEQIAEIARLIERWGWDQPIVVNEKKTILKGHGRWLAAGALKLTKVPCIIRKGLSEADQIAIRNSDNKVAESPWDYQKLKIDFDRLTELSFDLSLTAFSPPEIKLIVDGWQTDFEKVENVKENLDGISSVIKVICPQHIRQDVVTLISEAVNGSQIQGIEIE